ncbi:ribonuclease III [Bosea sp. (in: a-proteobacteria)]|uniref:ribonuclease III n=1 Tax=Bosea sp. (in: a-proteobacteria) TaxID=1871050 RepID=UPI00273421D5|nr:ribonuclease III [Bosea sp. (in: a-proteobacteria)]MDP3409276.1 ribonuclease III [Bosea sp. (in: a-proteobacteria)]
MSKASDNARKPPDTARLQATLGHVFADQTLLITALTHMSAEGPRLESYQRLEFLGDRVLGLSIADMLFARYPLAAEGDMSRRLADLVRKETCAEVAIAWNLGAFMRLGEGEILGGARKNKAILADACEAIIGAVFIDGGYEAARGLVERGFGERLLKPVRPLRDAKTALQEWAQGQGYPTPTYTERDRSGPDHAPVFRVAARITGLVDAEALGPSKRLAEQAAAEAFLRREGLWSETMESDNG